MGNSQIESEVALFNNAADSDSAKAGPSIDPRKRSVHSEKKGYSSEVPTKTKNVRKRRPAIPRRKLSDRSNSEDSESDDAVPTFPEKTVPDQPSEPEQPVNWWNVFNNNNLLPGCMDEIYLQHNSKYITLLLSKYDNIMTMIEEKREQIGKISDEKEILQNVNIMELMKKVQGLNLENVERLNYENLENLQRFFSFLSLTSFVTQCMQHDDSNDSKKFNILELISFYYDLFWILMAFKIKTMSMKDPSIVTENVLRIKHILFFCLFRMNSRSPVKRTRIDEKEYVASSILLDFCTNSMKKYFLNFEREKYTLRLIFPPNLFVEEKKDFFNNAAEEKNALIMANVLLFISSDDKTIEKYGMRVLDVNKGLFRIFGQNTLEKLNKVLYFNFMILNNVITLINQMWFALFEEYSHIYVPLTYHSPENLFQKLVMSGKLNKHILLHSALHEINYPMKADISSGWFEKSINVFSVSAFSMDSVMKIQNQEDSDLTTRKSKDKEEWVFNNISYRLSNFIGHHHCFELMLYLLFQIQIFKEKAFLGQNFVMCGEMMVRKSDKFNGFKFVLYHEIRPNLMSVLFANFRFFPSFDITLVSYFQKIRQLNCHVILDYLSPLFMSNGIVYNQNLKKIIISFNIDMNHIRKSLFQNHAISVGNDRLPTKSEELYLPLSWIDKSSPDTSKIPEYVRQNLTKIYGASDRFCMSNLMIASFTQNDVLKNSFIVLNTRKEKKLELTRNEIQDRHVKYKNPITTALFGKSLILSEDITDNITSAEKKIILENIDNVQEIHEVPIIFRKSIGNYAVIINLNSFETFKHKETQIICIDSFNISMILNSDDIRGVLEDWMTLYSLWPFNTSKIMSELYLPSTSENSLSPH